MVWSKESFFGADCWSGCYRTLLCEVRQTTAGRNEFDFAIRRDEFVWAANAVERGTLAYTARPYASAAEALVECERFAADLATRIGA